MAKKKARRKTATRKPASRKKTTRRKSSRKPAAAGLCNKGFVLTQINPKTGKRFKRVICLKWSGPRAKVRTHTPRKPNLIESPFPKALNGLAGRRRRSRRRR